MSERFQTPQSCDIANRLSKIAIPPRYSSLQSIVQGMSRQHLLIFNAT